MSSPASAPAASGAAREQALLAVEDLVVDYGGSRALFGVSLEVPRASTLAVLGPNGAGKSTLASCVSGLKDVTSGRITIAEHETTSWPAHRVARLGVAHLFEGKGVFPSLSVLDNLRLGLRRAVPRAHRDAALDRALELFPQLAARQRLPAASLSGGERQMLALARVLAAPPRLLLADEPSLGLAPMLVDEVFEVLGRAREEGVTILLIEQFVSRALAFADRAVVLRRGQIVWSGDASEAGEGLLATYLGEAGAGPGTDTVDDDEHDRTRGETR